MSGVVWQAAALSGLGALLALALPAQGGVGIVAGALGVLAAGGWLAAAPDTGPPVVLATAGLAMASGLIGQARLFGARGDWVPGGWRGRAAAAGAPLLCTVTLVGSAALAGRLQGGGLPRGGVAVALAILVGCGALGLLLAGLAMVAWRGRAAVARGSGSVLRGRIAGARLALVAGLVAALGGFGALVCGIGAPGVPTLAAVLLVAVAAVCLGLFPMQGLVLGWLETAPPWLAGGITAAVSWPAMLGLLAIRLGPVAGSALLVCGAFGVAAAGVLAATRRAGPREATWLALGGLMALGLGAGAPASLSGAVLAGGAQVLVACLPAALGRAEAVAMGAGCFMPLVLVSAGMGWWALPPVLVGIVGLGVRVLAGGDSEAVPDRCRWLVLALLLGVGLVLPEPVARLAGAIAVWAAPA